MAGRKVAGIATLARARVVVRGRGLHTQGRIIKRFRGLTGVAGPPKGSFLRALRYSTLLLGREPPKAQNHVR